MEDKQTIITALAVVIAWAIPHAIFVAWYLYKVKLHVQKLYQKTAIISEQARDSKAMAQEAQQQITQVVVNLHRNNDNY